MIRTVQLINYLKNRKHQIMRFIAICHNQIKNKDKGKKTLK